MNSEHPRALDISCHWLVFLNNHRGPTRCSKSCKTLNQSEFISFFFLFFTLINRKKYSFMSKWWQITTNWSKEVEIKEDKMTACSCSPYAVFISLMTKQESFWHVNNITSWHDNWFSIADNLELRRHQRFDPLPHPSRMVLENKGNLDCSNYRLHIATHQLQCNILISLSQQTGAKAVSQP